ncbi:MAG: RNA-directed DNA polymerase, partial [Chloroflexi bacterium]|nr:RNA-directed DNA polymerase [Chloroflexota bacterium]
MSQSLSPMVRPGSPPTPLNQHVVPVRYPLPVIKDLFLELRGARFFSKLDLRKGYYHIQLDQASREYTTTLTHQGLFRYKRLPMRLTDSVSVFQQLVSQTLARCKGAVAYIDDILIFGATQEEHDANLEAVLRKLAEKDFRLQMGKCRFSVPELTFVGHTILAD